MKDLFLIDGSVGLELLEWLVEKHRERIFKVVHLENKRIITLCEKFGIPHMLWQDFEVEEMIKGQFDRGFCIWWPHILSQSQLCRATHSFYNLHPSLLPFQRGKGTSFWNIVEETPFGVTIHEMTQNIDAGKIIAQRTIRKSWEDTGGSLSEKAQLELISLFKETYPLMFGKIDNLNSDPERIWPYHSLNNMLDQSKLKLDELMSVRQVLNLLRAKVHSNYQGCTFEDSNEIFEVQIKIRRISGGR